MNLLRDLVDSLATLLSNSSPKSSAESDPASGSSIDGVMDSTDVGTSISNERTAFKLGGYFDLAKEEIAKALRAEEWGLTDDAIAHYNIALQLLVEAQSLKAPSFIGFREREKVNCYHQKILKWQCQVSDRLRTLSQRTAITSTIKNSAIKSAGKAAVSSVMPNRQVSSPNTHGCGKKDLVLKKSEKNVNSKSDEASVGYDTKLVEMVNTMIVDGSLSVSWNDINGLEKAKQTLMEMVILPTKRRDLFTGLRKPPRGLLLFGPPGNGKTMLAKAVASESDATFFNISSSSLTSKWVGEGEKLMRALFMVAASKQPSVIFFDEMDSMMSSRTANEHDASRRLKSEFLVHFDGVNSKSDALVIVIGATNKPQELDDAVIRRLVKRIYVPLPDLNVRTSLLKHKLKGHSFSLPSYDLEKLAKETDGYSGSDIQALCEEAAMIPIRELGSNILTVKPNEVRPLTLLDFQKGMAVIRPSLKKSSWEDLEKWNSQFGSN